MLRRVTDALALAITFWLVEVALAHLWLGRFRLGPAEWLLRRLTYGVPRGIASD